MKSINTTGCTTSKLSI